MSETVTLEEVWKLFKETDRRMQESRAETDRRMQETGQYLKELGAETDRRIKDLARQVGNLSSRWGEFVEGVVAPACKTIFANRGIPVHKVSQRVRAELPGNCRMEVDLLVVNTDAVILVEVKSKLMVEDVRDHVKRLAGFKDFFTEYADKRVMGAVAGIVIEEDADRFAINQGLFVIVQSGETATLANGDDFVPRTW